MVFGQSLMAMRFGRKDELCVRAPRNVELPLIPVAPSASMLALPPINTSIASTSSDNKSSLKSHKGRRCVCMLTWLLLILLMALVALLVAMNSFDLINSGAKCGHAGHYDQSVRAVGLAEVVDQGRTLHLLRYIDNKDNTTDKVDKMLGVNECVGPLTSSNKLIVFLDKADVVVFATEASEENLDEVQALIQQEGRCNHVCNFDDKDKNVCGSDGVTYSSSCALERASCQHNLSLSIKHIGSCDKCENMECARGGVCVEGVCLCSDAECSDSYEPVCADNGHIFFNVCHMHAENCRRRHNKNNNNVDNVDSMNNVTNSMLSLSVVESRFCSSLSSPSSSSSCPEGVAKDENLQCTRTCLIGYFAFTTNGCRACECHLPGSESVRCDATTGRCTCKSGFDGLKCDRCLDGSSALPYGCRTSSTRYSRPLTCGSSYCDFGATCSTSGGRSNCVCEIDCRNPLYYRETVCGSDGNTYRSECQLRQYSCRIQKEVSITAFKPCNDAPTSIYGSISPAISTSLPQQDEMVAFRRDLSSSDDTCQSNDDCVLTKINSDDNGNDMECVDARCVCKQGLKRNHDNKCLPDDKDENKKQQDPGSSRCDPNPCQGGGQCEEHDNTFSCICPSHLAGSRCQLDLRVNSTSLEVASFKGNSIMAVITPDDTVNRVEIELQLRPLANDGIILYAFNDDQDQKSTDFLALILINGHVEFRFDLGEGPVHLRSPKALKLNKWHDISARRYHRDGLLRVDGQVVKGEAGGTLRTLNVDQLTWIGNAPYKAENKQEISSRLGTNDGLVGCVQDVHMNRRALALHSDREPLVMQRKHVVECQANPCIRTPCLNQGRCQASALGGFVCKCSQKFAGRRCQKARDECSPNPCKNGGKCVSLSSEASEISKRSFECRCPTNFDGLVCEQSLEKEDSTRIRKSTLTESRQRIAFGLRLTLRRREAFALFELRSANNESRLSFAVDENNFLLIELTVAEEPTVSLRSKSPLNSKWMKIEIVIEETSIELSIDNQKISSNLGQNESNKGKKPWSNMTMPVAKFVCVNWCFDNGEEEDSSNRDQPTTVSNLYQSFR